MHFCPPPTPRCVLNPAAPPLICSRSGASQPHQNGSQGTTAVNKSVIPASTTAAFLLNGSTSVPGWVTFLPQASLFSGSIRVSFNLSRAGTRDRIVSSHPRAALSSRVQPSGPGDDAGPPAGLPDSTRPEGHFLSTFRSYEAFYRRPGGTGPSGASWKLFSPFVMSPIGIQGDRDPSCLTSVC